MSNQCRLSLPTNRPPVGNGALAGGGPAPVDTQACQPLAAAAHDSDSDVTGSAATTVTQLIRLIITKCLYYLRNDTNRDDGAAKVT